MMFESVRFRELPNFSLSAPPPLPSINYRNRLKIALQTYRRQKGKGWNWIIKNEIYRCVTNEEWKNADTAECLNISSLRAKLWRWCDNQPEQSDQLPATADLSATKRGDIADPRITLLIERLIDRFAPEVKRLLFITQELVEKGRIMANFLSVSPEGHAASEEHIDRSISFSEQGQRLVPGKYILRPMEFLKEPGDVTFIGYSPNPIQEYFKITDVGEINFYKVDLIAFGPNPTLPLPSRFSGFFFPYSWPQRIVMRNCLGETRVLEGTILTKTYAPKPYDYFLTLARDKTYADMLPKHRYLFGLDDVYPLPTDYYAEMASRILDSLEQEIV